MKSFLGIQLQNPIVTLQSYSFSLCLCSKDYVFIKNAVSDFGEGEEISMCGPGGKSYSKTDRLKLDHIDFLKN